MTFLMLLVLTALWFWVRGKRRASGATRVPGPGSVAVPGGRFSRLFIGSRGSM